MRRAARSSCVGVYASMGPCGPLPSCLYRDLPATPRRADRRVGRPMTAAHQAALRQRRGHPRQRAAGAGPHHQLVFCDRVLAILVVLRFQLPHHALAVLYGVDRAPSPAPSTRSDRCWPAVASPSPTSPACGCTPWRMCSPTPPPKGFSCAWTAPRPRSAGHGPTAPDGGRLSPARRSRTPSRPPPSPTATAAPCGPGRCDRAACTTRPPSRPRDRGPAAPASHRHGHGGQRLPGLAKTFPDQVHAPPPKPSKDAPAEQVAVYEAARKQQSTRRICVEHAIAEPKQWRSLQRWIGRRQYYAEAHLAVAGLVSDRTAHR